MRKQPKHLTWKISIGLFAVFLAATAAPSARAESDLDFLFDDAGREQPAGAEKRTGESEGDEPRTLGKREPERTDPGSPPWKNDPPLTEETVAPTEPEPAPVTRLRAIEEIVVTANRREQDLQDVIGSIQVLDGDALDLQGVHGFDDYIIQIPGIGYQKTGSGGVKLGMRGISNVIGQEHSAYSGVSTVGLYIDDVPMQGSGQLPDLALYDLDRVEVLKGPQGTLYGEGAMGGAIKMILNRPNFHEFEGKADALIFHTAHGGWSNILKAAGSGPLWDERLAVRLVGTTHRTSGYIDDLFRGEEDANSSDGWSFRVLGALKLTDHTQGEILFFQDHSELDRFSTVNPDLPDELQNDQEELTFSRLDFRLYGLTLKHDFGPFEVTAVASRLIHSTVQQFPFQIIQTILGPNAGVRNEPWHFPHEQTGMAYEVRMVSTGDKRLDWILGLFYRDRESVYDSMVYNPDMALPPGNGAFPELDPHDPTDPRGIGRVGTETFEQWAAYAEGVLALLDGVEVTAGLRLFSEKIHLFEVVPLYNVYANIYATAGEDNPIVTDLGSRLQGVLPKLSLAWRLTDDHMVFGLVSRGFRSGAINNQYHFELGRPIVDPDYLWNYEIGAKTLWLDGALAFNTSAFFLTWKNFQSRKAGTAMIGHVPIESVYVDNAGDAESYGVETSLSWMALDRLTLQASLSYLQGEITSVQGGSDADVGSLLPNLPEWSPTINLNYAMQVFGEMEGAVDLGYQYVDTQTTLLQGSLQPTGRPLEPYQNLKLSLLLDGAKWGATLFADNLLDERSQLGSSYYGPNRWLTIGPPRTVGFHLRTRF